MKSVVITGSTRGLGFGQAQSFLARGCSVTVSSRSEKHTDVAKDALAGEHGAERVFGTACDVRDPEKILSLWDRAV